MSYGGAGAHEKKVLTLLLAGAKNPPDCLIFAQLKRQIFTAKYSGCACIEYRIIQTGNKQTDTAEINIRLLATSFTFLFRYHKYLENVCNGSL